MKINLSYPLFFVAFLFIIHPSTAQTESLQKDSIKVEQGRISVLKISTDTLEQGPIKTENVTQTGKQGMGMGVRLTGTSTLNIHSNPLIVVNGIPYGNITKSEFDFTTADERDYAALIFMSPEDIQEIAVENDGTSISRFGSAAANGAILITTKRGIKGKPVVNYRYESSVFHQPKGYKVLNGDEYIMLMREEYHNAYGVYTIPPELAYDPSYSEYYNYSQNSDWPTAITRNGFATNQFFSVSGGTKRLDYHVSSGYVNQSGITTGTGQKLFNPRLALDYTISDRWKLSAEVSYTYSSKDVNFQRDGKMPIQELALRKMPNMSIDERDADGNSTTDYYAPLNNFQGDGYTWYNPVALANMAVDNNKLNLLTPTFTITYRLFRNLTYNFYISYSTSRKKRNTDDPNLISDTLVLYSDKSTTTDGKFKMVRTQNQLIFTPQLNKKHSLTVTALFNTYAESIHIDDKSSEKNNVLTSESIFDLHYKNYFSVFSTNYRFRNKYMLDVSGVLEGIFAQSSSFDYQFYPSATIKWIASNESFLKSISMVNDLTFKASYSILGNNSVIYMMDYNKERHIQTDLGADVSLLKNKLRIDFLWYRRENKNHTVGNYLTAIGPNEYETAYLMFYDLDRGCELSLNAAIIRNKDFSADFSLHLNRNRTLTDHQYQTGDPSFSENYIRKVEPNKPMGSIYGYQFKGVNLDAQDAIAKDKDGNSIYDGNGLPVYTKFQNGYTFEIGDARYADVNHDGIINSSDIVYLGDANPYFTGSGGPSFRYKGWWVGVYFNFRLHNKIINMARMSLEDMTSKSNQSTAVLNRWRAPGMITDMPRACLNNPVNGLGSDRFVEDGSFLRLKAITLKYQLSETFVKKIHLHSLEVYFIGNNLLTFTHYTGADPEIWLYDQGSNLGTDNNYTPRVQTYTVGINVGF